MKIAIYGCGQLARMLAMASRNLGIDVSFIAEPGESTSSVDGLGDITLLQGAGVDGKVLYDALGSPDVVTIDRETVNLDVLSALAEYCAVHPSVETLRRCRNRVNQKQFLDEHEIGTSPWFELTSEQMGGGRNLANTVVKAAESGYDGSLQWRLGGKEDLATLLPWDKVPQYIVEDKIDFDREISIIGVRSRDGTISLYPSVENLHVDGVLHTSIAPADALPVRLAEEAEKACKLTLSTLNYVGVLCIEFFVTPDSIYVNEIATRVHNSGHWTEKGAVTSQFENHIRAILGLKLGSTEAKDFTGLVNILGNDGFSSPLDALDDSVTLHWYNKPFKQGRKLGHVLVQNSRKHEMVSKVGQLEAIINGSQHDRKMTCLT